MKIHTNIHLGGEWKPTANLQKLCYSIFFNVFLIKSKHKHLSEFSISKMFTIQWSTEISICMRKRPSVLFLEPQEKKSTFLACLFIFFCLYVADWDKILYVCSLSHYLSIKTIKHDLFIGKCLRHKKVKEKHYSVGFRPKWSWLEEENWTMVYNFEV